MKKKFINPATTVDLIIFNNNNNNNNNNEICLIQRKQEPYKEYWALPGGHLDCGKETLEEAVIKEGREETNLIIKENDLNLVGVYSDPKRDPRGHVISHVYEVKKYSGELNPGDDASKAEFFHLDSLPKLAFDHDMIIKNYLKRRENV